MPKTRNEKQTTVTSLTSGLKTAKAVVFANFQGLKVSEAEELRKQCRKEKVEMLAAKKTLLKRACEEAVLSGVDPMVFKGGVATFFGTDEVSSAKIVNTFAKTHEILAVFGGLLEGKFIDAAGVKSLAALPSKQELLGQLVGTLNAPVSGFVNVLAGNLRSFVSVLNNVAKSKA